MKSMNETIVAEYYDYTKERPEDTRLNRSNAYMLEYITTMHFINKYLKTGDKILEEGCATGIYSLDFAKRGYDVTAFDISDRNLGILRNRITDNMTITTTNLNATNLDNILDKTYDVTLLLGPLYHLFSTEDKNKAIKEAKRVTKRNGLIFISFLSKDYIMMQNCELIFENSDRYLTAECEFSNNLDEIFNYFYVDEFDELMNQHNLEKLHILTTDGISQFISEKINTLSDSGYQKFLNYNLRNCERRELLGFSPHILFIGKNS